MAIDVRLAVDTNLEALRVYRHNFDVSAQVAKRSDISVLFDGEPTAPLTRRESYRRSRIGPVDFLVAGPPCQGHSDLNNFSRRRDPRNGLYLRAVRAIEVLQPALALIENVPAVIHDSSKVVLRAEDILRHNGYSVTTAILDAAVFGLPQRRRRHILLASRLGNVDLAGLGSVEWKATPLSHYLSGLEDEPVDCTDLFKTPSTPTRANQSRINFLFSNKLYDLPDSLRPPCHRDKAHSYRSMYGRMKWQSPAQTITSGFGSMGQGRFVHPIRPRTLTPHEAARIQGFPDFFSFAAVHKRTALQEMIGNAVPPPLSATIACQLFARLPAR